MNEKSPFEYASYKEFLLAHSKVRGIKARWAETVQCRPAFISQVLNGDQNLNLEQAEALSRTLELNAVEKKYFLTLVLKERAGTHELEKHFNAELAEMRSRWLQLKTRLEQKRSISEAEKERYYASWIYSAIHILVGCPSFNTATKISTRLRLSPDIVANALATLKELKLIESISGSAYKRTSNTLHLPHDSKLIQQHHINWRTQCLSNLQMPTNPEDFHYSSVISMSLQDVQGLRKLILNWVEKSKALIQNSGDEELYSLSADFYRI